MAQRSVLITGGSRGIGAATARRFAVAGAAVTLAARHAEPLNEMVSKLTAAGHKAFGVPADVADADQAQALVRRAAELMGGLDVLVNNAGVAPNKPIDQFSAEDWAATVGVNLSAVVYTTGAAWPIMRAQSGGVIINLSSAASRDPFPGFAHYGASKAAVNLFTKAAAREGAPHHIRVYALAPGAVDTRMLRGPFPDFPAEKMLKPEEVAEAALQLASPAARYQSGQTIFLSRTVL